MQALLNLRYTLVYYNSFYFFLFFYSFYFSINRDLCILGIYKKELKNQ